MKNTTSKILKWSAIENIATLAITVGVFVYTKNIWSFLLLLNLNVVKIKK